ncbi:hypothetical protein HGRIS_000274 [Hohenbuehelia grisea]|uniref:Uncharacterized protein n=1 Tax=Hohenbuehelia grisea TaxID=104357 RepID=A0ABR3JRH0_9AGAR
MVQDRPPTQPNTPRNSPTPPPQPKRKTHASEAIVAALKKFPRASRIQMNSDKTNRNLLRELKHARHEHDPDAHPDDASDASSLLTISDDEDAPATTATDDLFWRLANLSPASRGLASAVLGQRRRDEDDPPSPIPSRKRACRTIDGEIPITPGVPVIHGFHSYLFDLDAYKIYTPLHFFTNTNIRLFNREVPIPQFAQVRITAFFLMSFTHTT